MKFKTPEPCHATPETYRARRQRRLKQRQRRLRQCCTLNGIRATNRWVSGVPVATEEKYGRLKQLMEVGKEKGFVLYDEVNELLTEDFPSSGREFEDLLSDLDSAGVEILEEPKLDFDKRRKKSRRFRRPGAGPGFQRQNQ